ncbi:hypothetical protein SNE510_17110 [Streptomyces sp. NE5-10]|nr:hypothetical protein SNE510_17110 [Streptomyces sp. NE5-10]
MREARGRRRPAGACAFVDSGQARRGARGRPATGVVRLAASLNAAGTAVARGGAGPAPIVRAHRAWVSTTPRSPAVRHRSGIRAVVDERRDVMLNGRMNAEQRLVTRDHIDFGRVWSAACCA